MRIEMETIEILSAKLRNAEADRDRYKQQSDQNFREKEEYRLKYEQTQSQAQLDNMESNLSQCFDNFDFVFSAGKYCNQRQKQIQSNIHGDLVYIQPPHCESRSKSS